MELGDTSDEEASPPQPKKREMSKNWRIQMVSMLQMLQTEDSMRRGAFTIVAKCFCMACLMVHCIWNRVTCMCASGHIISPKFHSHKKLWEMAYVSVRVHQRGNQRHPITESADSKKAGDVIGGVKDNSASLDC